jgi:hypothetical protein
VILFHHAFVCGNKYGHVQMKYNARVALDRSFTFRTRKNEKMWHLLLRNDTGVIEVTIWLAGYNYFSHLVSSAWRD